ncbi:helix-turn-helix domain-containing protein [Nocardia sp. SYP-A9097]|uniref:helix-turn-helix domain-containing protein n=1 Tax=Nocardia sp. SYP-A9097 TaxID=2663237 RepID=UPI00129B94F1|nr:helix-turn-helix transcriptional regulator [Nocardia sp. SYP-A9097]MRH92125.1 helix-turn-helix domain-containing protein [Nocardia sp. SYP-A9097]
MTAMTVGDRIERARVAAGMSQRDLATETGISQATLSRTISGDRAPKMNELVAIAAATGVVLAELTGASRVAGRLQCAARSVNGASMESMYEQMLRFLELDAYLVDQGIAAIG